MQNKANVATVAVKIVSQKWGQTARSLKKKLTLNDLLKGSGHPLQVGVVHDGSTFS